MLLLHTVLAVVYGGLLVSARPQYPGRYYGAEGTESTSPSEYSYYYSEQSDASQAAGYEGFPQWAPNSQQQVLGAPPQYTEEGSDYQEPDHFPGAGHGRWPEPPHQFPGPPPHFPEHQPEFPHPPHHFPESPHYPPPAPHHPPHGPPPGPPPRKGPFPHFPKPDHHKTKDKTIYQFLETHPKYGVIPVNAA